MGKQLKISTRRKTRATAAPKSGQTKIIAAEGKSWRTRIDKLFAGDVRAACDILSAHGFTVDQAKAAIARTAGFGAVNVYAPDAAAEFRDPTHPCHYAAHILQLQKFIADASPEALQVGRSWGRAAIGLKFPEIAKAMQGWWLSSHRGKGGRRPNDLTRTLEYILQTRPNSGRDEILNYLQSEESEDEFGRITDPKVHITSVEVEESGKVVTYVDRGRKTHTIALASLDRKLRDLRPK
jgi:hypothetical protein